MSQFNPLQKAQTEHERIATRIGMRLTEHRTRYKEKSACLIVEGATDAKLHNRFIDHTRCFTEFTTGKDNVLAVLRVIRERHIPSVIAIVDYDYDFLDHKLQQMENLFFTDTHDHETMMLYSPALEGVLSELMPPDKLSERDDLARKIRKKLLAIGMQLGWLRYVCAQTNISWNHELDFAQAIESHTLKFNIALFIDSASMVPNAPSKDEIAQRLKDCIALSADAWLVCNGHDLITLLTIILPISLQKYALAPAAVTSVQLNTLLRASYDYAFFQRTRLYMQVKQWEDDSAAYRIYQPVAIAN